MFVLVGTSVAVKKDELMKLEIGVGVLCLAELILQYLAC